MVTFRKEAVDFYQVIKALAIGKASLFTVLFLVVYFIVFFMFLNVLTLEIWQTHNVMNMIPDIVLEKNKSVQEQVCKRKGVK